MNQQPDLKKRVRKLEREVSMLWAAIRGMIKGLDERAEKMKARGKPKGPA